MGRAGSVALRQSPFFPSAGRRAQRPVGVILVGDAVMKYSAQVSDPRAWSNVTQPALGNTNYRNVCIGVGEGKGALLVGNDNGVGPFIGISKDSGRTYPVLSSSVAITIPSRIAWHSPFFAVCGNSTGVIFVDGNQGPGGLPAGSASFPAPGGKQLFFGSGATGEYSWSYDSRGVQLGSRVNGQGPITPWLAGCTDPQYSKMIRLSQADSRSEVFNLQSGLIIGFGAFATPPVASRNGMNLTYGLGMWLAALSAGVVAVSLDGLVWNESAPAVLGGADLNVALFDGSQFIVAGLGGNAARSYDGVNWFNVDLATAADIYAGAVGELAL